MTCFPKSREAYFNRGRELRRPVESGEISAEKRLAIREAEVKSGKLKVPEFAVRYTLRGHSAEGA